ncbi:MAG: hypothetical protein HOP29_13910 [Phycisphaerales bacterium]|nr:hypothetical protein [Phycisphaerales bacterium]
MIAGRSSPSSAGRPRETGQKSFQETAAPEAPDELVQGKIPTPDGMRLLLKQVGELKEYLSYYVSAKTDSVKLGWWNIALWMVLSALGFITLGGFLITASWFVLNGCAEGLGVICGNRFWIGRIVTGVVALAGSGLGMFCAVARRKRLSRQRTVQRYEKRQARQQTAFGHAVCDQATDAPAPNK